MKRVGRWDLKKINRLGFPKPIFGLAGEIEQL